MVAQALIIEDDVAIAELLRIHLSELGLKVEVVNDAETGWKKLQSEDFAICLLDWMLPQMQGIELVKKMRDEKINTKILMLTARADTDSIVTAIETGADDYVTKPFDALELVARVRNLLRRSEYEKSLIQAASKNKNESNVITLDHLTIDFSNYRVLVKDEEIYLTPSEFKLMAALIKAGGQVLTRNQLIGLVQGDEVTVTGRTVDTHVFTLRKKLSAWPDHIETIRGVGYRIHISKNEIKENFESQLDYKS